MEKRILVLSLAAAGLIFSGVSQAATSKSLDVMATVASSCTLDVTKVDFGTFSGTDLTANGEVRVNCNVGVNYKIGMTAGANPDAAPNRRMTNGAQGYLPYRLTYFEEDWGDTGVTNTTATTAMPVQGLGKGVVERFTVGGLLWAPITGSPAPGIYTDTVMVTVAF